jgi:hypothetical protein
MASLVRNFLMGFFLLVFLTVFPEGVMAEDKNMDMDGNIKRLEALEARVDAKIRKLEEMEARLEAKFQPVAARTESVAGSNENGIKGRHGTVSASAASGAAATRGSDLEARVKHLEEESIHQVMFRGGFTHLNRPAESAGGALGGFTGPKNDTDGWNVGAVIGVKLLRDPFLDNPVMGEVSLDFSRISGSTTPLSGLQKSGNQSLFRVAVTPKYRFDNLGDFSPALSRIRPWLTPIGLSFLVNSPPSTSANYLTVGGTTGGGLEYLLHERLSVGLGLTYNFYDKTANRISTNHLTVGPYVGINY